MSNDVVAYEDKIGALTVHDVKAQVNLIQHVMREVMKENEHYGVIPGTGTKPTLLKAGAEKLCLTFRLAPSYEITELRDGNHLTVMSKCTLTHIPTGKVFGSGMGSCSTKESKYAYRNANRKCPNCGAEAIIKGKEEYGGGWLCFKKKGGCGATFLEKDTLITGQVVGRVVNEDVADQYNTVLKMANKRSLVAVCLNSLAASDIFTQDIEDMPLPVKPVPAKKPKEKDMGAAVVVGKDLEAAGFTTRESELEALAKENGKSPEFYLNRAGVNTASEMSDSDWNQCVAAIKKSIAAKKERAQLLAEGQA